MRFVLPLAMLAATCMSAASSQTAPAPPPVICQPCGETPPPQGFSCFGKVMISDAVTTDAAPKLAASCSVTTANAPPTQAATTMPNSKKVCAASRLKKKKRKKSASDNPAGGIHN